MYIKLKIKNLLPILFLIINIPAFAEDTTQTHTLNPFEQVQLSGCLSVLIKSGDSYKLEFEGEKELAEQFDYNIAGGVLRIEPKKPDFSKGQKITQIKGATIIQDENGQTILYKNGSITRTSASPYSVYASSTIFGDVVMSAGSVSYSSFERCPNDLRVKAIITVPALAKILVEKSAHAQAQGLKLKSLELDLKNSSQATLADITTDKLSIHADSHSSANGTVTVNEETDVDLGNHAQLALSGSTKKFTVHSDHHSKLQATGFVADDVVVRANHHARVSINPQESVDINAEHHASVTYEKEPKKIKERSHNHGSSGVRRKSWLW